MIGYIDMFSASEILGISLQELFRLIDSNVFGNKVMSTSDCYLIPNSAFKKYFEKSREKLTNIDE